MSHAFAGVLTCAKIHSIELDSMSGLLNAGFNNPFSDHAHSKRRRFNEDVWRSTLGNPSGGILGLVIYRSLPDNMWIRYQCE